MSTLRIRGARRARTMTVAAVPEATVHLSPMKWDR